MTVDKGLFLGMYCLSKPFKFSLLPLCQLLKGLVKYVALSKASLILAWSENSFPLLKVIVFICDPRVLNFWITALLTRLEVLWLTFAKQA